MKSKAFSLLGKGEISHLVTSTEDTLASSSTVYEGADNEGWEPVLEDNGSPRAIKTDRIIEGYISSERLDNQKDIVPLEAFTVEMDTTGEMPLIEWIAKNSELMWVHGHTDKGSLAIGNVIGYKVEKGRPKFRWGIKKGSTLIDDCWEIMKQHGTAAGFSIGGAKLERECDDNKCILHKLDVVEVSWTPNPANPDAVTTFINKLAKQHGPPAGEPREGRGPENRDEDDEELHTGQERDNAEDDEQLEKPCPWKKKAMALLDKYWDVKDPTPSKVRPPKLGPNREILELEEGEDDDDAEKSASSTGDEHGPSVSTKKGDDIVEKETEPIEKADEILAGLGEIKTSIDAMAKALIKQNDEEEDEDDKDAEKQEDDEEEEDKDTEKQDDEEEDDKKDEEKSVKKSSDEELLGEVLTRGLAPKIMDLQKGGALRPGGAGKNLGKSDDDSPFDRRMKARIARAEKLQGAV